MNPKNEQLQIELTKYARLTTVDNECYFSTAVRMMRDEPSLVAEEIGTTTEVVIAWCDEQMAERVPADDRP